MKIFNFKVILFLFAAILLTSNHAMAASTADAQLETAKQEVVKENKSNRLVDALRNMRDGLEAKAAEKELSKKEAKALKMLDRKIDKWDRKAEKRKAKGKEGGDKNWIAALLLCWFLGILGIHRFYLGYIWQGVVQLLTLGGLGIWTLIDFIRIIIKDLEPKDGSYID